MISIPQYLLFLGLGLNSYGDHDDLFMLIRSSQYIQNYNHAIKTELPRNHLHNELDSTWFNNRFDISESHWKTYFLASSIYTLSTFCNNIANQDNSKIKYNNIILFMLSSSFLFAFLIFLWIINKFLDENMLFYILIAFTISMVIFVITYKFNLLYQYDARLFGKYKDFQDFLISIPTLLLKPTFQYHFLSYTPRSQFTLMLLMTFLLRWNGFYKQSYWALFIGFCFHAGMGLIFFGFIFFFDLIRKIMLKKNNFNLLVIILIPSLFILRSDLLFVLLSNYNKSIFKLFIIVPVFIILVYILKYLWNKISIESTIYKKIILIIKNPINGDIILFFCAWIFALPIVFYLHSVSDEFSSRYLWSQILGRPLAMMHGPILVASIIYYNKFNLMYFYKNSIRKVIPIVLCYVFAVCCYSSINTFKTGYSTFYTLTNNFNEDIHKPFEPYLSKSKNEAFLLYLCIRSFEDNKNYFRNK